MVEFGRRDDYSSLQTFRSLKETKSRGLNPTLTTYYVSPLLLTRRWIFVVEVLLLHSIEYYTSLGGSKGLLGNKPLQRCMPELLQVQLCNNNNDLSNVSPL